MLAALLFSFLCFPADKVLAASNVVEVPLTVKQNFEENSNEKGIDLTGTYEFRALDIGIPYAGEILITTDMFFVLDGNNAEKDDFIAVPAWRSIPLSFGSNKPAK